MGLPITAGEQSYRSRLPPVADGYELGRTHWGRVGETGQSRLEGPVSLLDAQKAFEKKVC